MVGIGPGEGRYDAPPPALEGPKIGASDSLRVVLCMGSSVVNMTNKSLFFVFSHGAQLEYTDIEYAYSIIILNH